METQTTQELDFTLSQFDFGLAEELDKTHQLVQESMNFYID